MDSRYTTLALYALGAGALTTSLVKLKGRLGAVQGASTARSPATPAWRGGLPRWFRSTNTMSGASSAPTIAPEEVALRREAGFMRLARAVPRRALPKTRAADGRDQGRRFRPAVHRRLSRAVPVQPLRAPASAGRASFVQSSSGVTVTDLDGNEFYDLTGSYGVNLFGYDFYKECIDARRRAGARSRSGARRLSSGGRLQRASGCARFPGSTRSRSTCPAPRP